MFYLGYNVASFLLTLEKKITFFYIGKKCLGPAFLWSVNKKSYLSTMEVPYVLTILEDFECVKNISKLIIVLKY